MSTKLAPPKDYGELKGWMRQAGVSDFMQWLRDDPNAYAMFAPHGGLVSGRVTALPEAGGPFEVSFLAAEKALNPWGHVHGGVLLGLLDEVMSAAAALHVGPRQFAATTTMSVSFLRPVQSGCFRITATVIGRGLSAVVLRGQVWDAENELRDEAMGTFAVRTMFSTGSGAQ